MDLWNWGLPGFPSHHSVVLDIDVLHNELELVNNATLLIIIILALLFIA